MNSYQIEGDIVIFRVHYNANFVHDIKEIPGRKYDPNTRMWSCPINFATTVQIHALIEQYNIQNLTPEDSSISERILQSTLETAVERKKTEINSKIAGINIPWKVYQHQIDGIAYMLTTKRCINGSDMGTGKTLTAILSVEFENLFPCMVVVPASVKYNWQLQWKLINPERTVSVIENAKSNFDADVLVITYDSVGKKEIISKDGEEDKIKVIMKYDQLDALQLKSIICDESQNIKSSKTLRSKAIKKLAKKCEYRFMLTGTTIMNRPSEIINVLDALGQFTPVFGNWKDFVFTYCGATQNRFGLDISGATNTLELNRKLRESCYYRVEKRDVLKDLPDRVETLLQVDLDNRKQYDYAQADLLNYLRENFGRGKSDAAALAEQLVMINTLTKLSAEGKKNELMEWIDNFLESSDEKLIVFGIHTEILKFLADKYKCDLIIGDVSGKKRQEIISSFQANKKRILFLNILTGSVGIDGLQHICNTALFYELPWRPTDIEQAISRLERSGQKNTISAYFMLAKNTIDIKMWEMLTNKKQVTDAVNMGIDVEATSYMKEIMQSFM